MNKLLFASVISEIQQSDIFMTVKARICEAPAANLNGARVTENFISEIVDNKEQYVGLPLYADKRSLLNGDYRRLGHLYDSKTGEFHSTQIGSFYDFEKEDLKEGCALVGYARIAKRNKKLSNALLDLFKDGALKFSFEVSVGEYEELEDGTILIDASDSNYLEGTAIVTFPACEDAVALQLVAQQEADDIEGGEKEMAGKKLVAAEQVAETQVNEPETAVTENAEVNAPEVNAENDVENNTEAVAETNTEEINAEENTTNVEENNGENTENVNAENAEANASAENAAVYIDETHRESITTYAYDTESNVSAVQDVSVTTSVSYTEPEAQIVETDEGVRIAEDETTTDTTSENPAEQTSEENTSDGNADTNTEDNASENEDIPVVEDTRKVAEQNMIAELIKAVEELKNEIAELKETKVVAETKVTAEVNPMFSNIQAEGKYSLLEKEDKTHSYSLLSK